MKFFTYDQNNSGGSFDFEEWNISQRVIVEAEDSDEADVIAEELGLYFDGEGDCSCCGDRWSYAYSGSELPSIYGVPVWRYYGTDQQYYIDWMGAGKADCFVHYYDGTVEAWEMGKAVRVKESGKK